MTPTSKTELLKTQASELIKQYVVLDGQSRPTTIYTAKADAKNGDPCTRVDYTYATSTSTVVVKMKESYDTWVSATMD